ncbi:MULTISPECIES: hypothetical protein [Arthrobacter]|nr:MULTISPECIES: hypothetical protein [Arthrobacter]NYG15835.1 hypothetical protein [Arthrobacter psychrochitiniphilus]
MRKAAGIVAAVLLLSGTGCGQPVGTFGGDGCMPPSFSLSADAARPGESFTISADDATCNPRYGDTAQIQLEVMDGSGVKIVDTLAPMNDAGGFSTAVTLPESAVPGTGSVAAFPYNLDWCDDTGRNNRVGHGAAEIHRASCVLPSQTLTIEP